MKVTRIHEDPRVTKPYSDAQWADIDALGRAVDRDLAAAGARLTQGGEPTFVSIDDMDGPEWNFTALSPKKWQLAEALAWRLRDRFAPGGLLFYGQGKWYPGEPLPRWALGLHWRRDGRPLWRNGDLIAREVAQSAEPREVAQSAGRAKSRNPPRRAPITPALRPRARARARARRELRDHRVRGPAAAAADRRRPAGERRRGEGPAQGLRRPRATAAQPGARHGLARRLCPAAPRAARPSSARRVDR